MLLVAVRMQLRFIQILLFLSLLFLLILLILLILLLLSLLYLAGFILYSNIYNNKISELYSPRK